eukprot:Nitzschia sp. Nitz4//scaffold36_size144017//107497//107850//NITZ4_003108-RA/size144017-processed-gene-0.55-mRNA-1//1//CDS//3329549522//8136//frame0
MTPPTPQSSPSQPSKMKSRKITPVSHVMNLLDNEPSYGGDKSSSPISSPKDIIASSPRQLPLTPGMKMKMKMRNEMMLTASENQHGSMRLLFPEESEEVNWLLNVFDPSVAHMSDVL